MAPMHTGKDVENPLCENQCRYRIKLHAGHLMTTQSNLEVKSASSVDVRWQNKRSVIPLLMSFTPLTMDINCTRCI